MERVKMEQWRDGVLEYWMDESWSTGFLGLFYETIYKGNKMKILTRIFLLITLISLPGCLLFHKVSYDVKLTGPNKGTAYVTFYDIRSDAKTDSEFVTDKNNIFTFIPENNDFITQLAKEGKNITSRALYVSGDTLNGKGSFNFDKISAVEGIIYEDGFYYLTLPLEDSVITTNGEIIVSKDYKRILWDKNETNIKFQIYSTDFSEGEYKKLAKFFKKK